MTTLFLKRVGNALLPEGDESVSMLASVPFGKSLKCKVWQPRNIRAHRLFFAVCKRIGDGVGRDAEQIATVFKLAADHVEIIRSKNYGEIRVPKSIAFDKMDNVAMSEFMQKCFDIALSEWGIEPESLADLIDPKTEVRG